MSDNLDSLAILLATSLKHVDGTYVASKLQFYGETHVDPLRSGIASNMGRRSGLEGGDSMIDDRVKIVATSQRNQIIRHFDLSKDEMCALVHGQALECGVGPWRWLGTRDRTTYFTAKDVLMWRKVSEWLEKSDRKYPEDESISDLLGTFEEDSPNVIVPHDTLVDHISDMPKELWTYSGFRWGAIALGLPIIYGGIHLTAWDNHFASKTEQLLWKIACFATIGMMPITLLQRNIWVYIDTKTERTQEIVWDRLFWYLASPRIVLYILLRLYIVVEAFVSLRHVPIGVYAAVSWVQAIPHV